MAVSRMTDSPGAHRNCHQDRALKRSFVAVFAQDVTQQFAGLTVRISHPMRPSLHGKDHI